MDFVTVALLVVLWFVRPQDIISSFAGFSFVKYLMIGALLAMLGRKEGFSLKQVFYTPIDWAMFGYLGWIVLASESKVDAAKEVFNLAAFYTTTALAISNRDRFRKYLNVWLGAVLAVAIFALSSHFGYDIVTGSSELTSSFKERLALNTWIFNNPNNLGHGVVAIIPIAYMWLWRGSTGTRRIAAIACFAVAGLCVFFTESKGAYLAGGGAFVICLLVGKKLPAQLLIIGLAGTLGLSALKLLPRMDTLNKSEEGIEGRMLFWQQAKSAMENNTTGVGWKQFRAELHIPKQGTILRPAHGSYVTVGADLGYIGLLLYVAVLFCGWKALWQAKCPDAVSGIDEWERVRGTLIAMLACYSLSAWILDKAYHTDYFLIAGAVAAFHRCCSPTTFGARTQEDEEPALYLPTERRYGFSPLPTMERPAIARFEAGRGFAHDYGLALPKPFTFSNGQRVDNHESVEDANTRAVPHLTWSKLRMPDAGAIFASLLLVLYLWEYLSTQFVSI